jgi:hypothetical protein
MCREVGSGVSNVTREQGRLVENIAKETVRAGDNVVEFGDAAADYLTSYVTDTARNLREAEERLRTGKVADAFFHMAYGPLKDTDNRVAKLAQDSSVARTAMSVGASAYGGPGGAAAFTVGG